MNRLRAFVAASLMMFSGLSPAMGQWIESSQASMSDIRGIGSNGSYLFAGAYAGVYRSGDNGSTWVSVMSTLDIHDIASVGTTLVAGAFGSGIWISTDDGVHWTQADSGLANHNISCVIASGSTLFAGSNGAVQCSTDGGRYWTPSDPSLLGKDVTALALTGSGLFTGASSNVYRSTDFATSWSPAGSGFTGSICDFQCIGNHVYAGTVTGIYRTNDNGQSWSAVNTGLTTLATTSLAVDGMNIFAGTAGGGVYLSTDGGASWSTVNTGLTYFNISTLYVYQGYLYAGTNGTVGSVWRRPLSEMVTSVGAPLDTRAGSFELAQNYPNPFNPSTTIGYRVEGIGERVWVTLRVYDNLGREVATLVNEKKAPGSYEVMFDGTGLSSGMYYYRLTAGSFLATKKVLLLR